MEMLLIEASFLLGGLSRSSHQSLERAKGNIATNAPEWTICSFRGETSDLPCLQFDWQFNVLLRKGVGLALRNISIIPRVPVLVLGVWELFPNSAVTHSSTESTYTEPTNTSTSQTLLLLHFMYVLVHLATKGNAFIYSCL